MIERMDDLFLSLAKLAQLQGHSMDRISLRSAVHAAAKLAGSPAQQLTEVSQYLQQGRVEAIPFEHVDPSHTPALVSDRVRGWGVLRGRNGRQQWVIEWPNAEGARFEEEVRADLTGFQVFQFKFPRGISVDKSPVFALIRNEILQRRKTLFEIFLGGLLINVVAIATALYSMQVYDRVVPTGATQTLLVLTLGVVGAVFFEFVTKLLRSNLNERLVDEVDGRLARHIYTRFLAIRMDQIPNSVGALAAQLRGYEMVRGFLTAVSTHMLVDAPCALVYVVVVAMIAGPIGLIPLVFLVVSLAIGLMFRRRIESMTGKSQRASNLKTGLLVETIEGAETIKAGQSGWRMLMRWLDNTDEARVTELEMRNLTEHSQYWMTGLQQLSYVLMVAMGALLVTRGEVTMGGLIACSILSGRILGPVAALPGLIMQWAHSKTALHGLDRIWSLEDDHHGFEQPVVLDQVRGHYELTAVESSYGSQVALAVLSLVIEPGEKVAILGPVGSGKTTLLRLLSGMYRPQAGIVKLDGIDLSHVGKPALAEQMGYLQQEGRLFSGTLRENLVLGLMDPGDAALLEAARLTGLDQAVLDNHPLGLQQPIHEGGTGLSGGQRQLVNLTRVFLRKPCIWLLDEPTASMDRQLEIRVMQALKASLRPTDTMVVVTHKFEMLQLADRLIVLADHGIAKDGPRAEILRLLQGNTQQIPQPRIVA